MVPEKISRVLFVFLILPKGLYVEQADKTKCLNNL